jgi:hypothetical protein
MLFEDFSDNGNGRVHWVRNDENEGLGARFGNPDGEITDNTSVALANYQVRISA